MERESLIRNVWLKLALLFLLATLLGLFSASRLYITYNYGDYSITWGRALSLAMPDWYAWALLTPLMYWLAGRFPIERKNIRRNLAIHISTSILLSFLKMIIEYNAIQMFSFDARRRFPTLQFHPTILTYWAILGIIHAFNYYIKYRRHELKSSQLEARLAQAQLQALKMQLQPHFLFNTLHAISALIHRDVEAADRMIAQLSDLLRLSLENVGIQEVSLKQEVEFLERYLEIEKTRFQDRLSVKFVITSDALDASVPNLLLQPLVENAIRHGIAPRSIPGKVEIRGERVNGCLRLEVLDDGPGIGKEGLKEGIGLTNTRARLNQLYGANHRFDIRSEEQGGLSVSIELPFRISDNSQDQN